jgi:hypothetical protein
VPRITEKVKSLTMLAGDCVTVFFPGWRFAGLCRSLSRAVSDALLRVDNNLGDLWWEM